ncbi:MAG: hypothetical protein WDN69_12800 [Aliidongia sp.]
MLPPWRGEGRGSIGGTRRSARLCRSPAVAYADRLLAGNWPVFDVERQNVPAEPDWFLDPLTGRRAPQDTYCFAVPHRRATSSAI